MIVEIIHVTTTKGPRLKVISPYNEAFPAKARKLGGSWSADAKCWYFDPRDETRVRDLCMEYYGSDGQIDDVVTLRMQWVTSESFAQASASLYGRTIAKAFGRDSGAKIAEGVIVLEGGFSSSGSMKNWTTYVRQNTVILIRNFPRASAEELVATQPHKENVYSIEVEEVPVDIPALKAERERLLTRVHEIDVTLAAEDYARHGVERAMTRGKAMEDAYARKEEAGGEPPEPQQEEIPTGSEG